MRRRLRNGGRAPPRVRLSRIATLKGTYVLAASGRSARQWVEDLLAEGVWTSDYGRSQLRFVTHRHIGRVEVEQAVAAFARVWERHARPRARAVG